MKKSDLIKKLSTLGIKVKGNYVRKSDVKKVFASVREFEFFIRDPGDPSVGIWSWDDSIKISFGQGIDQSGVSDFNEAVCEFLGEYFDCPPAITMEKYERIYKEEQEDDFEGEIGYDEDEEEDGKDGKDGKERKGKRRKFKGKF